MTINRKFAVWFSTLLLLALIFGLIVPDFLIFLSNTRKLEGKLQNFQSAYRLYLLRRGEYETIVRAIKETQDVPYGEGVSTVSVGEAESLVAQLLSTKKIALRELEINNKSGIPVNFLGFDLGSPRVVVRIVAERVRE